MPAPEPDFIVVPAAPALRVALEPAHQALNDLLLLIKADMLPGVDEWVTRTAAALTPEQRQRNHLVVIGLYYALVPDRSWSSFPAYVNHLAAQDPSALRNRVLNAYAQIRKDRECWSPPDLSSERLLLDVAPILESVDAFLSFLRERFPEDSIAPEIEAAAYEYLKDPPAMRALIVSHLRSMWQDVLAPEWERVRPMLQASVDALQQLDLAGRPRLEAAELVLGRDPEEQWAPVLERAGQIVFVPSAHVGPYLGKFETRDVLWVLFGARVPEGVYAPDLSRAELLVRLDALADDTRLRILQLLAAEGELCSPDIMTRLGLSQSAASRHLLQLSAAGYLSTRRHEGAKCFTLNPRRIEDTLRALSRLLLGQ